MAQQDYDFEDNEDDMSDEDDDDDIGFDH